MSEIILSIPEYITQVMLSNKRRVKYTKTGRLSKTSGTPKYHRIAGNDLWASLNPHIRAKILKEIKVWFYNTYVRQLPDLTSFPLSITFEFSGPLSDYDLDNLDIFYRKAFLDCLAGHVRQIPVKNDTISTGNKVKEWDHVSFPAKIPDDSVHYIRELRTVFTPSESVGLTITIKKYDRDEGKTNI